MRDDLLVVCYHAVSERWPAALSITPADLEDHVSLLKRRGYRGVTLSEAVTGEVTGRAVAITFDDAYRSVFELGRPILAAAGFPGSVFAPTAFIGQDQPMSWHGVDHWAQGPHRAELAPMSWGELSELAASGWEIGSHTRTHPRLTELGVTELDQELQLSRGEIESRLGAPCDSLAYPYGAHDERVVEAAARAGYKTAAVTYLGGRPRITPLAWPRIVIDHADSASRFRIKTSRLVRHARAGPTYRAVAAARRALRRAPSATELDG